VRLLGIGLPLTITAGAIAGAPIFDQLSLGETAILAPTDAACVGCHKTPESLPAQGEFLDRVLEHPERG
jgi:hypothetical protein